MFTAAAWRLDEPWTPYQAWRDDPRRVAAAADATPARWLMGRLPLFERVFEPQMDWRGVRPCPTRRAFIRADAFDRWLDRVRAGDAWVSLLLDHDPRREVSSTVGIDGLRVWQDEHDLCFSVDGRRRIGAGAIRAARSLPALRQASMGCTVTRYHEAGGVFYITRAELLEVSLVRSGACPDSRIWFE